MFKAYCVMEAWVTKLLGSFSYFMKAIHACGRGQGVYVPTWGLRVGHCFPPQTYTSGLDTKEEGEL